MPELLVVDDNESPLHLSLVSEIVNVKHVCVKWAVVVMDMCACVNVAVCNMTSAGQLGPLVVNRCCSGHFVSLYVSLSLSVCFRTRVARMAPLCVFVCAYGHRCMHVCTLIRARGQCAAVCGWWW